MRGAAATMTVVRPRTVAAAMAEYARTPTALPFAGGTDLMVAWNLGELNDRVVLDLSRLMEWTRIRRTKTALSIGALATHTALQRHDAVRRHFGLLAAACATIGGVQIQNRGTIGGNIANGSPAADTFPALAVYDARVHLISAKSRRALPLLEIFSGPKKTTLAPGELIEAVELPIPSRDPDRQLFRKVGTRAAQAISKTVVAATLWLADDGSVEDARLAVGSMAPTVKRLTHAETWLIGRRLTPAVARDAAVLVEEDVAPIDDVRSTAAYRLAVSQRIIETFLGDGVQVEKRRK
jgi:xanthine dehydrogenase FAD-binding subunit